MTLPYNMIMLLVDVLAIYFLRRRKGPIAWCVVMTCAGGVALVLGGILAGCFENHFGVFRLWSYGVFLHGSLLLVATAILQWRDHRGPAVFSALAALAALMVALDAFLIEPGWLEVSHVRIASPKIQKPVRIVVVADLQTDRIGVYERSVLRRALDEKPDVILLAGDYLQTMGDHDSLERELRNFLREIRFVAPMGTFAVRGNVDPPCWRDIFKETGVTVVDAKESFDLGALRLTCLGMYDSLNTSLEVANDEPDRFHLVLGHMPDFALGKIEADLLVTGHTHGGQVRIPGLGPVITHARIPNAWAAGLTELPGGGMLLVSRGIGMERDYAPPVRFLCRPELVVIDLVPEEKETTDER